MKYTTHQAHDDDRARHIRAIVWCQKMGENFNGLPYDDSLAGPDGVSINLLVEPGTDKTVIEKAATEARRSRDVVEMMVTVCPASWFEEAKSKQVNSVRPVL